MAGNFSVPFIVATGPWYTAYKQPGWACPYGNVMTYGHGIPPYTIYFTNATTLNPSGSSVDPTTIMRTWGPYNDNPGGGHLQVDDVSTVIGNVYTLAIRDVQGSWAYSDPVVMNNASDGLNHQACRAPPTPTPAPAADAGGGGLSDNAIGGIIFGSVLGPVLVAFILRYTMEKWRTYKNRRAIRAQHAQREVEVVQRAQMQKAVVIELANLEPQVPDPEEVEFDELEGIAKIPPPADEEQAGRDEINGEQDDADVRLPEYHF